MEIEKLKQDSEGFEYSFTISANRLKAFSRLTPEKRLQWLEEAHEFVSLTVTYEKIKRWKLYLNKEKLWKRQNLR